MSELEALAQNKDGSSWGEPALQLKVWHLMDAALSFSPPVERMIHRSEVILVPQLPAAAELLAGCSDLPLLAGNENLGDSDILSTCF